MNNNDAPAEMVEEGEAMSLRVLELERENLELRFSADLAALAARYKSAWSKIADRHSLKDDDSVDFVSRVITRKA